MKRNKLLKRILSATAAAAVSLSAVSCSFHENTHDSITSPHRISFSWWGSDERSEYTFDIISSYEKQNSGIIVQPFAAEFSGYKETLDALYECGKVSDVVQLNYSWVYDYSPDGTGFYDLYELSDYIRLENFSKEELSYGTINGKLNAIPISLNAPTFFYNETLFNEYGLSIPKTWDDLFTCAEVLSADGIYELTSADIYLWLMLCAHEEQISGKAVFDAENNPGFDRENIISMYEFYKLLLDKNVVSHEEYDRADFLERKSASQLLWVSDGGYYVDQIKEKGDSIAIGDYLVTESFERSGWYVKPTSLYAISKNTQDPECAAKFLDYILNDSTAANLQGTEKGVPLSKSAIETLEANDKLTGSSFEASRKINESDLLSLIPTKLENPDIYKGFFTIFESLYYDKITIEEAADEFMEIYLN